MAIAGIVLGLAGIGVFAVTMLVAVPSLRHASRNATNATQLRSIHQAIITQCSGNRTATGDGQYAGFDRFGQILQQAIPAMRPHYPWHDPHPPVPQYGSPKNGTDPGYRFALLLNGDHILPEYLIAPNDSAKTPAVLGTNVTAQNYSYAALELGDGALGRRREWKETINSAAVVLSDRNTGSPDEPNSVWTNTPGDWTGTVVRNDGSAMWVRHWDVDTGWLTPVVHQTRYGGMPVNTTDHLFKDETGGDDAWMITGP
jgi:type II secretory pathway pseudopilin PulG